jgi:hypothetical protein
MNHAKLMRGVGIVPQGKIDLNWPANAPKKCAKHKISTLLVQCTAGVTGHRAPKYPHKNYHLKSIAYIILSATDWRTRELADIACVASGKLPLTSFIVNQP